MKDLNPTSERLHSLDALRGIMMLLGVVLHGIVSYGIHPHGAGWPLSFGENPVNASWPFQDSQGIIFFDVIYDFIHVFRMPLFFVLSGFFAHMVISKKGKGSFIESRKKRILYPLLVFWPLLFPLVGGGMMFLMGAFEGGEFKQSQFVNEENVLSVLSPLHLWFLYYLLYFYVAFLAYEKILEKWPSFKLKSQLVFEKLFLSPLAALFFALPLALFLYLNGGKVAAASTFIPDWGALITYFLFFLFGRYLHASSKVRRFERHWHLHFIVAIVLFVKLETIGKLSQNADVLLASVISAVCVWSFIFFWTGFFLRFLNRSSRALTFLAESSYWIYLIHLPLVIWLVVLFKNFDIPILIKASAVLTIAFVLLILSYEFFVRKTFIGRFLNGR